ncbi:MAG: MBL fold metallo-hydrolase [Flavobacteriales bacterium]
MKILSFTFNPFMENSYVILDDSEQECLIIDPGCYEASEQEELSNTIRDHGVRPSRLINTHCHIDHVLGDKFVCDHYGLKPEMHEKELVLLEGVNEYAPVYGFRFEAPPRPDRFIQEGEHIEFGTSSLEVLLVPGHSPGHIVLYDRKGGALIGGDVLFQGGIGRTDFPHCDHDTLISGIRDKLFNLPDETVVHPGHGPSTTIGQEKLSNPFVGGVRG